MASEFYLSDKEEAVAKASAALDLWLRGVREAMGKREPLPIDGFLALYADYQDALAMEEEFECVVCKESFDPKQRAHKVVQTQDPEIMRIVFCDQCREGFKRKRVENLVDKK